MHYIKRKDKNLNNLKSLKYTELSISVSAPSPSLIYECRLLIAVSPLMTVFMWG